MDNWIVAGPERGRPRPRVYCLKFRVGQPRRGCLDLSTDPHSSAES